MKTKNKDIFKKAVDNMIAVDGLTSISRDDYNIIGIQGNKVKHESGITTFKEYVKDFGYDMYEDYLGYLTDVDGNDYFYCEWFQFIELYTFDSVM